MKKLTTSEFIDRAKKIHGEKYDYSKVNYTHNHVKTKIRCHLHGDFEIVAYSHLAGHGCNNCYNERRALTREGFIERARRLHNNKYDYSNVVYTIGKTEYLSYAQFMVRLCNSQVLILKEMDVGSVTGTIIGFHPKNLYIGPHDYIKIFMIIPKHNIEIQKQKFKYVVRSMVHFINFHMVISEDRGVKNVVITSPVKK